MTTLQELRALLDDHQFRREDPQLALDMIDKLVTNMERAIPEDAALRHSRELLRKRT